MVSNALVYLGGPVVIELLSAPRDLFGRASRDGAALWSLIGGIALIVLLGVAWGAAYGASERRWLPRAADWLRGLTFAVLPLVSSLLVVAPALVRSDVPGEVWLLITIGESVRWAVYGVLLGLIYPIFRARRALGAAGHRHNARWRVT
jgi:hypothetical protein